jgi:peptide/nickel transport system substrate-binding protein
MSRSAADPPGTGLRKETTVRHRVRALTVSALALSLAVAGCAKNTGGGGSSAGAQKQQAIIIDTKGTSPTPAPDVPGAKPGGTLEYLQDGAPEHLDPQQMYVTDQQTIGTLIYRSLTFYIEDSKGGPLKLVGDLATNTGESSNNNKTWTYHLRDGIKFSDGSPITSKDIAYGVARSFGKYGTQGPQYIQNALQESREFKQGDMPPGVTTPDDKTIVFNLEKPHPEFPYLAALQTTVPVPKAKDDGDKYEADFIESGPYMKDGPYDQQTKLKLKKNPNWDPKTDAIRHQYADAWLMDFSPDRNTQTQRLIADQGGDAYAVMQQDVAQASIAQVQGDPNLSKRTIAGPSPFVDYININTQRVTDVKVRQALNYALDRAALIKAMGGSAIAAPATTIMAPVVPGYKNFDAYPTPGGSGDVEKAKSLLGGQTPKLTYCFANTSTHQQYAVVIKQALERAGFQIALNPIDRSAYYTTIGDKTTTCDLMRSGWGQDFPDGSSTLNVLMNGELIVPKGNQNYSYLNDPATNKKLDELQEEPDRAKAATEYGDLDQKIMTDLAPLIPWDYVRVYSLTGSKVGGTFVSPLFALPNLVDAYAKS